MLLEPKALYTMSALDLDQAKDTSSRWFLQLRDYICQAFEAIERTVNSSAFFEKKRWQRDGGGGGEMSIMRGKVFEKVGVNISTVYGNFSPEFAKEIPGAKENEGNFWASGISLVAHMSSPFVPAAHMNTRMIVTDRLWFGGGGDLTPTFEDHEDTSLFHSHLKKACDKFNPEYYKKFKEECDKYFFLPHRNEPRGIGGIFFDYLNSGNWQNDFDFICEVGLAFKEAFSAIVVKNMNKTWLEAEKDLQRLKRGRYVEFNLLYDRGTRFGLMTKGNTEAILMSLPPEVKW